MAAERGKNACVLAAPAGLCMQTFMLRVNKESAMQLFADCALPNIHFHAEMPGLKGTIFMSLQRKTEMMSLIL